MALSNNSFRVRLVSLVLRAPILPALLPKQTGLARAPLHPPAPYARFSCQVDVPGFVICLIFTLHYLIFDFSSHPFSE